MKWAKYVDMYGRENGDWIAQGEHGHFLLWKEGRGWRVRYIQKIGKVIRFTFWAKNLREAKRMAEENYHWEA